MIRHTIVIPDSYEEWKNLPQEFHNFLDELDEVRKELSAQQVIDPLYPSYYYDWEVDSTLALDTVIYYWNSDKDLPDVRRIVEEIEEAYGEDAYDSYMADAHSY